MEKVLGDESTVSFHKTRINQRLRLGDESIIHIKKYPGHIKIKLNKHENSEYAYERIRNICEGIEDVILDKEVVVRVE